MKRVHLSHTKKLFDLPDHFIDLRISEGELKGPIVLQRGNFLEYDPDDQYELVMSNQVFEHIHVCF